MAPVAHTGAGNVTTASAGSGTSLSASKPSNIANDDVLGALYYHRNASGTITPPSGWTIAKTENGNGTFCFATKPITNAAGEPSTYEFSNNQGSGRQVLIIFRMTAADLTTPIDAVGATSVFTGFSSLEHPSVTAVNADCLLLAISTNNGGADIAVFTSDAAMTEVGEQGVDTGTSSSNAEVAQETLSSAGATGTRTATMSPNASNSGGFLVTIAPGSTDATATPNIIAATSSTPAPAVTTSSTASPSTIATAATVLAATAGAGSTATPGTIAAAAAVPQPSVSVDDNATATPATVATSAAVPAPAVATDVTLNPATITATATIAAPDILTVTLATPATIAVVTALPTPTLSASSTAAPAAILATAVIPSAVPLTGIDITATTAGPPRRKWAARTPRRGWDIGPPRRKWTAGPPRTQE